MWGFRIIISIASGLGGGLIAIAILQNNVITGVIGGLTFAVSLMANMLIE